MKNKLIIAITLCIFATICSNAAYAREAATVKEIEDVLLISFQTIDLNHDGKIGANEVEKLVHNSFLAMDVNNNGVISLQEWQEFSLGFLHLAEKYHRVKAYETARQVIYKRWNIAKPGALSEKEQLHAITHEFLLAAHQARLENLQLTYDQYKQVRYIKEMANVLK